MYPKSRKNYAFLGRGPAPFDPQANFFNLGV